MEGLMVSVWSLDLPQDDGDKAVVSVASQKETFLHSFLSLCIWDLGMRFLPLSPEKFSRDGIIHTDQP